MNILLNGTERAVDVGATVASLVDELGVPARGTAIVIDGEVVPRSEWPAIMLRDQQRIELITAVQGG